MDVKFCFSGEAMCRHVIGTYNPTYMPAQEIYKNEFTCSYANRYIDEMASCPDCTSGCCTCSEDVMNNHLSVE